MPNKHSGFTLIELLVTIAIVGILMSVAIPNFQMFILNARMSTQANDFMTAIGMARSEAIKRGTRVSICRSSDNAFCAASGTWAQGWIVFTDATGTVGTRDGTDSVLQAHGPLDGATTFADVGTPLLSYIAYGSSGIGTTPRTIKLCPPSPAAVVGRDIVISNSGRARVQNPPTTACT